MSVVTPYGMRRHASVAVRTDTGAETMYCGLRVERVDIRRDWREPTCKACKARMGR